MLKKVNLSRFSLTKLSHYTTFDCLALMLLDNNNNSKVFQSSFESRMHNTSTQDQYLKDSVSIKVTLLICSLRCSASTTQQSIGNYRREHTVYKVYQRFCTVLYTSLKLSVFFWQQNTMLTDGSVILHQLQMWYWLCLAVKYDFPKTLQIHYFHLCQKSINDIHSKIIFGRSNLAT